MSTVLQVQRETHDEPKTEKQPERGDQPLRSPRPIAAVMPAPTAVLWTQEALARRRGISDGTSDIEFRIVDWLVRLLQVLCEPVRVLGRHLCAQEPRYTGARHGVVVVRRSRRQGRQALLLWNVRREAYGAFRWSEPDDRRELAQSLLADFLQGDVPMELCETFAERAFPKSPAGCLWTLTTQQVEQILLTCVTD